MKTRLVEHRGPSIRIRSRLGSFARLSALLFGAASSVCLATQPLSPPQSNAYGKSFENWNVLQTQFAINDGLGDGTISDTVGKVRLLPYDFTNHFAEYHITLPPGTSFVKSPWNLFGEHYDDPNIRDDDPVLDADLLEFIFETTTVKSVLDGKVLLNGVASDLDDYRFGPVAFDEPIEYAEPQFRFQYENEDGDLVDVHALSALFIMGIGSVYKPLPPGPHTLVETVHSEFFGDFQMTYHITVTK